jgi:hypothetical protein
MIAEAAAAASLRLAPQRHGAARRILNHHPTQSLSNSITIQADVVDARLTGLDTSHYLLKVFVFDLQSITDQ